MSATESFRQALHQAGLDYAGPLFPDGKLHRFKAEGDKARNSWYALHAGPLAAGAFGCWKRGFKETWCERKDQLSQAEWQRVREHWQQAEMERERTETQARHKARQTAARILRHAKPVQNHAYLDAKGVKPHGEVYECRGLLVLPLRDSDGTLHTLQGIAVDGSKEFLPGGRVAGSLFTLADTSEGPLVICEGFATGASVLEATGFATICAMNCGNLKAVAEAMRAKWPDREIILAADNDQWTDGNPGITKATAAAKTIHAKLAIPQFADMATKPTDFNDLHRLEGLESVKQQLQSAAVPKESDDEIITRLAALPPLEFDRALKAEAKRLGVKEATLASEVRKIRAAQALEGVPVGAELLPQPDPQPWTLPVDGADLLNDLTGTLNRFAVLGPYVADTLALFILATYAAECFDAAPYLHLCSPEKRCGKSLVMRLLSKLCARALPAGPCSESAIFRAIAATTPTLLIDEVDTFFAERNELRGILNVGCIRDDAHVMRTEEVTRNGAREFLPRRYSVFCPKVFAGIGKLADTLSDRCIVISMRRKRGDETRERFRRRKFDAEPLRQKCQRWTDDHASELEAAEPSLPDALNDRAADLWEPLLAVADLAGAAWSERARAAAIALSGDTEEGAPASLVALLLADIRAVFAEVGADRLASAELCDRLAQLEERPWNEIHHGKPLNANRLARLLAPYGVTSRKVRLADGTRQGYLKDDFADAWQRYLPGNPVSKWNTGTSPANTEDSRVLEVEQAGTVFHPQNAEEPNRDAGCSAVPLPKGGTGTCEDEPQEMLL